MPLTASTALRNSARQFGDVIRKDAGLAARLLRLANSAAFGLRGRVGSIDHAISLLGMNRMLDLAVCSSFTKVIPKVLPGYSMDGATFWRHNAATAVLSEKIAEHIGLGLSTEAFACGLLHDCGKLIVAQMGEHDCARLQSALREARLPAIELERRILGWQGTWQLS